VLSESTADARPAKSKPAKKRSPAKSRLTGKTSQPTLFDRVKPAPVPGLTLFQQHKHDWQEGCGGTSCAKARKRVYFRGSIPCDVLFIGEAPGVSEDLIGIPFVGIAGKLLDTIVARSLNVNNGYREHRGLPLLKAGYTNLVCCMPREEDGSNAKSGEPSGESVLACTPRLQEIIDLCNPRLIVTVGVLAESYLMPGFAPVASPPRVECRFANVTHPAAILRMNIAQQGLARQRCEVIIYNAVEELTDQDLVEHGLIE
jgi:uracil-DNA glycosylase family 4